MRIHRLAVGWLCGLMVLLAGCATPKPILDLAGQGTATVGLAEVALRDYLAITKAQLDARIELMRLDAGQEVRDASQREFDMFLAGEVGARQSDAAAKKIQELGKERQRLRELALEDIEAQKKRLSLDATKLPELPTDKLAAAKKSFGVLARELTPKEWVELAVGYAREIKSGVDKLREQKPAPANGP